MLRDHRFGFLRGCTDGKSARCTERGDHRTPRTSSRCSTRIVSPQLARSTQTVPAPAARLRRLAHAHLVAIPDLVLGLVTVVDLIVAAPSTRRPREHASFSSAACFTCRKQADYGFASAFECAVWGFGVGRWVLGLAMYECGKKPFGTVYSTSPLDTV
jgi:hypothetical protein